MLQNNAPCRARKKAMCILNFYAGKFQMQELAHRHPAATLQQGNYHAVDFLLLYNRLYFLDSPNYSRVYEGFSYIFSFFIQKSDHPQLHFGTREDIASE